MRIKEVLFYILIYVVTNCECKNYSQYTLYRTVPQNDDHLFFFFNESKKFNINYWRAPGHLNQTVEFIVSPYEKDLFLREAAKNDIFLSVVIPDLQSAFDNQMVKRYERERVETYSWDYYHTLEDIYQWLSDLVKKYPDWVELTAIGNSSEGREILSLRINRGNAKEKAIIEGGIHGNEWISTEYVTYLASKLLEANRSDRLIYDLAKKYDWYLIPILNPDGYVYSQKWDRLWRKNRRVVGNGVGVDLNRNFNYSFGKYASSSDPNDDHYCGPSPFSEPETRAISELVSQKQNILKFYFAFHGYGQKIVIPYGDMRFYDDDHWDMEEFSKSAVTKMYDLHNKSYSVGNFFTTVGQKISGTSTSWVKKNFSTRYVLTFLLRDNGTYGYALPPSEILPTCEEMLVGMTTIMTTTRRAVLFPDIFHLDAADTLANNWLANPWMFALFSIFAQ